MTRILIYVLQTGHRQYMLSNKPMLIRMLSGKTICNKDSRKFVSFKTTVQPTFLSCYSAQFRGVVEDSSVHNDYTENWKLSSERLRSFLYPNSEDDIIKKLSLCVTIQQVFDIIDENKQTLNHEHCSQALCVLWDLKKLFERVNFTEEIFTEETLFQSSEEIQNFVKQINSHQSYKMLVNCIENNYSRMTIDALSLSLLHLHKLGMSLKHNVIQSMIMRLEELMDSVEPKDFPLTAVSRISATLSNSSELWALMTSVKLIPHVIYHIGCCNDSDSFKILVISLSSVKTLLNDSIQNKFKVLVERLVDNGVLNSENLSSLVKTISILDNTVWLHRNTQLIRKLMLLCSENMDQIHPMHLPTIKKAFFYHLEPYAAMVSLDKFVKILLDKYKSENVKPPGSLVSAAIYFLPARHRQSLQHYIKETIKHPLFIENLFNVQASVTTSNIDLCNAYWNQMANFLVTYKGDDDEIYFLCSRYSDFCSTMGLYRNYSFETEMIKVLMNKLVYGNAGIIPTKFARIAAFIIAFDQTKRKYYNNMPKHIVSKLMENMQMFTPFDCLKISKGLQLVMDFQRRINLSHTFLQQFVKLNAALSDRSLNYLNTEKNISIHDLNMIMRAYINRQGPKHGELFQELIRRYGNIDGEKLTSRNLRDILYNILPSDILIPSLLDKIVLYCIQQKKHILGETAAKVLVTCYRFAYTPAEANQFLPLCAELLKRDFERLNGLSLIQCSLALNYFGYLPTEIINAVFTVQFLENLEEEITHCYQKVNYPLRLRQSLMQLNRAVCLDRPEAGIPWFHAKYCEEQSALGFSEASVSKRNPFYSDVSNILVSLVGEEDFIDTVIESPYGYGIHFVIYMDAKENPIRIKSENKDNLVSSKVAIILRTSKDYTTNVVQLKGYQQMKARHLEIMGYRVVEITHSFWNSMFMTEPKAKINYLRNLIWSKQENTNLISQS